MDLNILELLKNNENDDKMSNLLKKITEQMKIENIKKPSELKVSTISTKGKISGNIHLEKIVPIIKDIIDNKKSKTIVGMINGNISVGELKCNKRKNLIMKNSIRLGKNVNKRKFNNPTTLILRIDENDVNGDNKNINVKIFDGYSISITGSLRKDDALTTMNRFLNEMKNYPELFESKEDIDNSYVINYSVTMINTNYSIGFKINQIKLFEFIKSNYKIYISFNPSKYRGIIIGYMLNNNNLSKDGICKCDIKCQYKKGLRHKNKCKLITVAIFQKGNIVITGSSIIDQSMEVYDFINKIIYDNYEKYIQYSILDFDDDDDCKVDPNNEDEDEGECEENVKGIKEKGINEKKVKDVKVKEVKVKEVKVKEKKEKKVKEVKEKKIKEKKIKEDTVVNKLNDVKNEKYNEIVYKRIKIKKILQN